MTDVPLQDLIGPPLPEPHVSSFRDHAGQKPTWSDVWGLGTFSCRNTTLSVTPRVRQ